MIYKKGTFLIINLYLLVCLPLTPPIQGDPLHYKFSLPSGFDSPYNSLSKIIESFPINLTRIENGSDVIKYSNPLNISSTSDNTEMLISDVLGYKDLLKYDTDFINQFQNNSTGNIELQTSELDNSIKLLKNSTIYGSDRTLPLNISITGEEKIIVMVEYDPWMQNTTIYSFSKIEFIFDTFSINFLLDYSNSYYNILSNSSQVMYISTIGENITFPLNIFITNNSLQNPSKLQSINYRTYSTELYTINVTIDEFSLKQDLDDVVIYNNDIEISKIGTQFKLNQTASLSSDPNIEIYISYSILHISSLIISNVSSVMINSTLQIQAKISKKDFGYNSSFILSVPYKLEEPSIKLLISDFTFFDRVAIVPYPQDIIISGNLVPKILNITDPVKIIQNKTIQIPLPKTNTINSVFISSNFTIQGTIYNFTSSFFIPWNVPKGNAKIYFVTTDLGLFLWNSQIELSPLVVSYDKEIIQNPLFKNILSINVQNQTSMEPIIPDKIITYYNSSLRSVETGSEIIFWPGEFVPGYHKLLVIVSKQGFLEYSFQLELIVSIPELEIEVSTKRLSLNETLLTILPNIIYQSTIPSRIEIYDNITSYVNQTYTGSLLNLTISNRDWENETLFLVLRISLGSNNFANYTQTLVIDPYFIFYLHNESNNILLYSLILTFFPITYFLYRLIKKHKSQYISF